MSSSYDTVRLWLNDRLGKGVEVALVINRGDYSVFVLGFYGELRHFQETTTAERWRQRGQQRGDMAGSYSVGSADLDLTDLEHLDGWEIRDAGTVRVALGEDIYLEITSRAKPS